MSSEQDRSNAAGEHTALERLRDRTDELELIISSLTIFALLTIPSWLYDKLADVYTHLSTSQVIASLASTTVIAGVSYGLAACFVIHLMARAYWVGLIGLRTVFPDGIDWSKTPGLGPMGKAFYQDTLPDMDDIIRNTDKVASSLFAVISMLTLSVLWFGTILVVVLVVSGAIGSRFGQTNAGLEIGQAVLLLVVVGVPMLVYLLDAQLAARLPRLRDSGSFRALMRVLRRIAGLAFPQRLVLPVQLTMQSNTRPLAFYVVLLLSIVFIVIVGNTRTTAWSNFTLSDQFRFLGDDEVASGFRSGYYEDMASPRDRLRGWPRIDSFEQRGSFVRLFLPYQPLFDNLVLEELCDSADAASDPVACLRQLWTVSIEDRPVPLSGFQPAERGDLRMRGLIGLVPLSGLEPGLRRIEVVWNASAIENAPLDDRYAEATRRYNVFIAFAPDFEMSLPEGDNTPAANGTD
jgi:hypothetical protein